MPAHTTRVTTFNPAQHPRSPEGQPGGGQFVPNQKPGPDGSVTLGDTGDTPPNPPVWAGNLDDASETLKTGRDPLGFGLDAQYVTEPDGIHVYYEDDTGQSTPVGVRTRPDGLVDTYTFDPDDADFTNPIPTGTTSEARAYADMSDHLGVNEDVTLLTARVTSATPDELARVAAEYTRLNAGAMAAARQDAYHPFLHGWAEPASVSTFPTENNVEHGQRARAGEAARTYPAANAVEDAVFALQHAHQVGADYVTTTHHGRDGNITHVSGWTQEAYDHLTRPVRSVFGPISSRDGTLE